MLQLKVTLKQHTPLIHFQYDQDGATLRASEVKPRLDKFIIDRLGGTRAEKFEKIKKSLVGYSQKNEVLIKTKFTGSPEFNALNYKIRVEASHLDRSITIPISVNQRKKYVTEDFPLLLSNMGGKEIKDELVNFSYSDTLSLTFVFPTQNTGLYNMVKDVLPYFFACNNFGQRSDKGFGSFTVKKINDTDCIWNHHELLPDDTQCMQFKIVSAKTDYEKFKILFSVIDFYWKSLKSGINYTKRLINEGGQVIRKNPERYIKAYLYTYLQQNSQNYTWEKRKIKRDLKLTCLVPETKNDESDDRNAVYARALLGCPINGIQYRVPNGKWDVRKKREYSDTHSISITTNGGFARIASPIIFKPVITDKVNVYILFDEGLIEALKKKGRCTFTFREYNKSTTIDFIPDLINYKDLIKKHNSSFFTDKKRFESDFMVEYNQENKSKFSFKMVPRNIQWNNILSGKNDDNLVSFSRTLKK